jgi:hypothetical protein
LPAQRRKQPGEDERGLAAAGRPDDSNERMRLYASNQFADSVVAAGEKRCILFSEGLKAR